jgi:hypothetical protein
VGFASTGSDRLGRAERKLEVSATLLAAVFDVAFFKKS